MHTNLTGSIGKEGKEVLPTGGVTRKNYPPTFQKGRYSYADGAARSILAEAQ